MTAEHSSGNVYICKLCRREIVFVGGHWIAIESMLMFPQYCGFPMQPQQKHVPEKKNDEPQHHNEVD